MKFSIIQCSACEIKCRKTVPVINTESSIARFNRSLCMTHKKGQNIKLAVKVVVNNMSIKPNDLCFCGSGKKFKKCHLPEL